MYRIVILFTALTLLIGVGSQTAYADVLNVPDDYRTIQSGIDAAEDGDTVLVQPGEYVENIDFNGRNIVVASLFLTTEDESYIDSTIINGDENGSVVTIANQETDGAVLIGFSVTNGTNTRLCEEIVDGIARVGGGIYCRSNALILYCKVYNNHISTDEPRVRALGAGIFCITGEPTIDNCIISNNSTDERGGGISGLGAGIAFFECRPQINNCIIADNTSNCAIYASASNIIITNCTIRNNSNGGALFQDASNTTIISCLIFDNNSYGIAIDGETSSNIQDTEIIDNERESIICFHANNINIEYSIIRGVTRHIHGGAVYLDNVEEVSISYCQITGNETDGIELYACSPEIVNCTISNNSGDHGAIYCRNRSQPVVRNTIIWGNVNNSIYFSDENGHDEMSITTSYCDIEGGEEGIEINNNAEVNWGEGNIDTDPLFISPENGFYYLTEDSPCIDTGDPDSPLDPDSTRADMGAFYFNQGEDAGPKIDVFPAHRLDFANVAVGTRDTSWVVIVSIGRTDDLIVSDVVVEGENFTTSFEEEFILHPANITDFMVFFEPDDYVEYDGSLTIISNDPHHRNWTISLHGTGIDPRDIRSNKPPNPYPSNFFLSAAYPNPFNAVTTIVYGLPVPSSVSLRMYSSSGRLMGTLVDDWQPVGYHKAVWNGVGTSAGAYFVCLVVGDYYTVQKVVNVK